MLFIKYMDLHLCRCPVTTQVRTVPDVQVKKFKKLWDFGRDADLSSRYIALGHGASARKRTQPGTTQPFLLTELSTLTTVENERT